MKVYQIMTREVRLADPNDTIKDAAQLMADYGTGIIPVSDGERLVGMITDRDIALRCVADGRDCNTTIAEAMSPDVIYCFDDEDIDDAARYMATFQVHRLPVVNRRKRLVGIVSLTDIANASTAAAGTALAGIARASVAHDRV